jgi:hypothetical protein
MKMINLFDTNLKKAVLLIALSLLIFVLWQKGLETSYQKSLVNLTNNVLKITDKDTRLTVETDNGKTYFMVYTRVNGQRASFPQETGSLLEPFIIVLSWQIFMFFVINFKKAFKLFLINTVVFVLIQMLFLIFLTNFYSSEVQKFLYNMMKDSFYIVALILVIKDNMLYPVFFTKDIQE